MSKKKNEDSAEPVYVGPMASSSHRAVRETIESIVIAFILAFLFRTFEAEAFVIPTGSMAPTLHGMHKDLECPQCGFTYRVGASQENPEEAGRMLRGQHVTPPKVGDGECPQCGFVRRDLAGEPSYGGDRILVNKLAYQLGEPERWDVIVFRFPGDAKMNYIKRLVGLPNEVIEIFGGDIFTGKNPIGDAPLRIARKSHRKLRAMLQHVDDNHYIAKTLDDAGWPRRWQADPQNPPGVLEESLGEETFRADGHDGSRLVQRWKSNGSHPDQMVYIDYRHFVAGHEREQNAAYSDWTRASEFAQTGREQFKWRPDQDINYRVISDFYSYNTGNLGHDDKNSHWVGDLAIECDVEVDEMRGELILALEEGGYQFRVMFDIEDGGATLEIENHADADAIIPFGDDGQGPKQPNAQHAIAGPGKHKLMLANCDDKLYVWVDDKPVEFDGPTEYAPLGNTKSNDADLIPAHVGMRGFAGALDHIRLNRDIYYISARNKQRPRNPPDPISLRTDGQNLESVVFQTGPDQFFPLGDNSPESKDARIWEQDEPPGTPNVVDRRLLIGKAMLIYWPYGQLLPRWPLFERMKLIR
ncbi:MAG: signal peptidase I [Pirellulales bacterium]